MADVLIVGAGPTGLAFASELARYGISFRIIDQKEGPSIHSKALAIQPRTLELLAKLGLAEAFLEKGIRQKQITYHFKSRDFSIQIEELDTPFPFILILPQSETERLLIKDLEKQGFEIEWNTQLISLEASKAILEKKGKKEEVEAKWIIGCDGAHSMLRKWLNIPFKGAKFSEAFLLGDVALSAHPTIQKTTHLYIHNKGIAILFPLPGHNIFRFILPNPKSDDLDPKNLVRMLKERTGAFPEILQTFWLSKFYIHRRIATNFRKDHVFLAGDAAHIHSPAGGQGMNTSIQDAFNLAWKLSYVIQGVSSAALLDSYQEERRPIAKKVLKGTTVMTLLVTLFGKLSPALFYFLLKTLLASKKRRHALLTKLTELSVSYRKSPIVQKDKQKDWGGPAPGDRAPDALCENHVRLFELLKDPCHHVLLFEENEEAERAIKKRYGEQIKVHVVRGEDVKRKYETGPKSLYLIRPDGYIGYRSRFFSLEDLFAYLKRIFTLSS